MEKLKSGYSAGDKTFNVQVDGYDLLPYLTGEGDKSSRQGLACFSDDGDVLALRFDNWRVVFMEQGVQGTLQIWLEPFDDLLERAGPGSDLASALRVYLERVPSRPDTGAWWERIPRWAARRYERLAADPRFERVVTAAVVVYAAAAVLGSLLVVATTERLDASQPLSVAALGQAFSTLVGAALVARGVLALPGSRADAYHWFLRGVLVRLLISQVFIFYESQLAGLGGLALDIAAYTMLLYALHHETAPRIR